MSPLRLSAEKHKKIATALRKAAASSEIGSKERQLREMNASRHEALARMAEKTKMKSEKEVLSDLKKWLESQEPKREEFQSEEDYLEALAGFKHRAGPALRNLRSKGSRRKSKSPDAAR